MLNQIRKMLGLVVMVIRGMCDESIFETAFRSNYDYELPAVPARGLLLCGSVRYTLHSGMIANYPLDVIAI